MTMQATIRRLLISTGLAAGLTLTAACGGSSSPTASVTPTANIAALFPITVQTSSGSVVIPKRPTAIVSLSPTATEDLYAIGAGSQVKAVDKYSNYPAGTPMTKLSEINLNVESLAALKPDLVVVANGSDSLSSRMKALSIPLLILPAATNLDDAYAEINQLGQATGHATEALKVAVDIRAQIAQIVASVPKRSKPLTYFYELSPDFYSITSDTFMGQLLKLIGLDSIGDGAQGAAKSGGYPQLTAEYIIKANPDFVFLSDTICCQQDAEMVAKRPGWDTIGAVRAGHVVELSDDIASRWGPRVVTLLRTVADAVQADGS
jgi:iron complex transport system substrate-binding protein